MITAPSYRIVVGIEQFSVWKTLKYTLECNAYKGLAVNVFVLMVAGYLANRQ